MYAYQLDKVAAKVVLGYYYHQARKAESELHTDAVYKMSREDIGYMAAYLASTLYCEMRYNFTQCTHVPQEGLAAVNLSKSIGFTNHDGRDAAVDELSDYFTEMVLKDDLDGLLKYIRSAAFAFNGTWTDSSIGGKSWAYCAWVSAEWLSECIRRGYAQDIRWELMLNAKHNNARWFDKVQGDYYVLRVLNLGFKGTTQEIFKVANDVFEDGDYSGLLYDWHNSMCGGDNNWYALAEALPEKDLVKNPYWERVCPHHGDPISVCGCPVCPDCSGVIGYNCHCDRCYVCLEYTELCECSRCACGALWEHEPCDHVCSWCGGMRFQLFPSSFSVSDEVPLCSCTYCVCGRPEQACICHLPRMRLAWGMVTYKHSSKYESVHKNRHPDFYYYDGQDYLVDEHWHHVSQVRMTERYPFTNPNYGQAVEVL